jgi:hypothetical protein
MDIQSTPTKTNNAPWKKVRKAGTARNATAANRVRDTIDNNLEMIWGRTCGG